MARPNDFIVPVRYGDSEADARVASRLNRQLARKQAELLVEQLRDEGLELAADIVQDLDTQVAQLARDLDEVRDELAELKAGTKSSRGKERASASGTIGGKGRAEGAVRSFGSSKSSSPAPLSTHKHDYGSDGACIKMIAGAKCGALRQRNRKPKQITIPGTGLAGVGAGASP